MKRFTILIIMACAIIACQQELPKKTITLDTFCNPLDLSYRFGLEKPSRREAADPTIMWFKDRYFLFASKSGGYWHSKDLLKWEFIQTDEIPTEEYAPTVVAIADTVFFLASSNEKSTIYKSVDPMSGKWTVAKEELEMPVWDPAFLLDDDNKLYLYWGCSNENPLYGVELDYKNDFTFIGEPKALKYPNPEEFGWEVPGDYNTIVGQSPWIEGAWVNKHDGKYYLQYSGPGTEYKSYADAVYVSDNPLGPYEPQKHNPFAYKPEGFATGAGHGSTFEDRYGNYWHIGTITISQKHMFERRLGLYPTFFDKDGTLYANTKYADFPLIIPQKKIENIKEIFPEWMLLSYGKKVTASSNIDSLPAQNILDEDIRTYWAASSGNAGEYAVIDLEKDYDVYALQLNFAEYATDIYGREEGLKHQYKVEYSNDNANWKMLIDASNNKTDNSHQYMQLPEVVACRYLKVTNKAVPGGNFAISGFRVFGIGDGNLPSKIEQLAAKRKEDKRSVNLNWTKSTDAVGYNISYGTEKDKLYQNYIVYGENELTINTLNSQLDYYFKIEAFNESGITTNEILVKAE
ncbi:family 43 glycosylhydrolase [Chondrinema litorale]|uniref:family 43 glycosylhydrolase n=1 Tax=Chondrinema litorale TaxID=2994555 RepID=UPI0025433477|nr:family 43 glycosylhydrolase [Chondrinema litorale]UZR96657.1 family 43 glycosylhydrolase [Chondrinema litorale]